MPRAADTADRIWSTLSPALRKAALAVLLAAATLPVFSRQYLGRTGAEIPIFIRGVEALLDGRLYAEHVFEYPPYALIWFLAPYAWSDEIAAFRFALGLEIWLVDAVIKATLLWRGVRARDGFPDLVPFLAYSLGSAALGHLLLMKYDLIPAALSLAGVLAVAGARPFLGGVATAVAAGSKAYPALFIPVLAVVAWRRSSQEARRFVGGVALATAPLLLLSAWMPWWNFASFHGARGLEVGSLAASLVWALHFTGIEASWALIGTSNEVGGPLASALLGPARVLWVASTLACVAMAVAAGWRMVHASHASAASVAALTLLTATSFVATNTVFSPQFHLWLIPLAALALEGRRRGLSKRALRGAWVVVLATVIVPTFYPSREYAMGLGLWRTMIVVLRNLLLLYATVCLWRAAGEPSEQRHRHGTGVAQLPV